ncbi:hypothetical protein J2Z83_000438 [Virgibacillus natechei]|uniref:Uncharacterized protein n=1 Tax=Virgibacillus natechei TaxID=1216297 RepID=A0ABS4IDD1_9BACI|nr:hypothetical protein [Virgibacillus natechei]
MGKISFSNISFGSATVQQEFGISTTPAKCPFAGAELSNIYACSSVTPFVFKNSIAFKQALQLKDKIFPVDN